MESDYNAYCEITIVHGEANISVILPYKISDDSEPEAVEAAILLRGVKCGIPLQHIRRDLVSQDQLQNAVGGGHIDLDFSVLCGLQTFRFKGIVYETGENHTEIIIGNRELCMEQRP